MAEVQLGGETVAALIGGAARPYVEGVDVAVVGDVVRMELHGVLVPVLGRVKIVLLMQVGLVDAAAARVWVQVQKAAGLLTPLVRAFVRPLLVRLVKAGGLEGAVEVESGTEMTVHLDRLRVGGRVVGEWVVVQSLSAPAGVQALGCVFQVRQAARSV